jgi:hypothetical protein
MRNSGNASALVVETVRESWALHFAHINNTRIDAKRTYMETVLAFISSSFYRKKWDNASILSLRKILLQSFSSSSFFSVILPEMRALPIHSPFLSSCGGVQSNISGRHSQDTQGDKCPYLINTIFFISE